MFFRKKVDEAIVEEAHLFNSVRRAIEWDQDRLAFTPDYQELSQKKSWLFFIHDDMMQTQPNHFMVEEGSRSGFKPLDYGYTSKSFSFVKKELGLKSFPIALDIRDKSELPMYVADSYRIRGEIYALRPQQIVKLDIYRQNGVQFHRQKVNINIGSRKQLRRHWYDAEGKKHFNYELGRDEMCTQEMWMYVARTEYWMDQLTAGFFDFKPISIIQEDRLWLKEYYQYSRVR